MKALFVHSSIFYRDSNDKFYTEGNLPYSVWKRYLPHFNELVVAGRVERIKEKRGTLSSGSDVTHVEIPNITNPKTSLKNKIILRKRLTSLIENSDFVIARMPSEHAYIAIKLAKKMNKPFMIEVVGDVLTSLWYHGNPVGKVLGPLKYLKFKATIKKSPYVVYVTEKYLQKKYPPTSAKNTQNISNVELTSIKDEVLNNRIKKIEAMDLNYIKLGLIGSYSSKYKGIETAIEAIKLLNDKGLNVCIEIVGNGDKTRLFKLAEQLGVQDKVVFVGTLESGDPLLSWLDSIDIYIQPSLTEGLPRALIEAMSRGCPSVASKVGGIPELLQSEFLHNIKSENDLTFKILKLLNGKEVLKSQAIFNFNESKKYHTDVLSEKRYEFFKEIIKGH